jgi:hypothetical protein
MKNFLNKKIRFLLLFFTVVIGILVVSCNNEDMGSPVITAVRNYAASPKDTIMTDAVAKEQWVVIQGQNLGNAVRISFDGVPASFNSSLLTSNSAVVKIPAITFSKVDVNKMYTIEYVTSEGTATFSFKLGPAAPTVTSISDVFAEPADSVYIYGKDLVLVKSFSYGGTPITSFKSNLDGSAVGFLMPSPAPVSGDVVITTFTGVVTYKISADPIIYSISNENALANDSVFVYGTYLKGIQSFSFGGTPISSYKLDSNGKSIGFVLPPSPQTGPVSITTTFGSVTTLYNVNDTKGTSSLSIADGGDNWQWWAASKSGPNNPDFPGNNTEFFVLDKGTLLPGDGWPWTSAVRLNPRNWIAQANINDPIENYALKFEVNIPNDWNGGSMLIQSDNDAYTYRAEPWQKTATTTAAYKTKGWMTVTVPFTEFRSKDTKLGVGRGDSMTEFISLLGTSGKSGFYLYLHNYDTSPTITGFKAGFDNIRVVKIK